MVLKNIKKLALSLSVAAVLSCCASSVFADEDRIEALEARIDELETLVEQLLVTQQQPPAVNPAQIEARAEIVAEKQVTEMMALHHDEEQIKASRHAFKFGGYVKSDLIYSDFGGGPVAGSSAGRDFYYPDAIPVGESGESYLDLHAKERRINFKSTHNLDSGARMGTFIEIDFLLSGQGDERVSNSFAPRLRHAFFTYDKWLFGQTWMTFFNVGAQPENLDFVGPSESIIFGRQAMIRYTDGPWQFSVENPETTITPFGGGSRIIADDNKVPDLVGRYNLSREWGYFSIATIFRELAYENTAEGIDDSEYGYGISVSGIFMIGERDDFRWMASTGSGLGRYIGLNTANGAVLDGDGNLHAIDSTGIFGSYRHIWNQKWRSNLTLGYLTVDNDVELTGTGVSSEAKSVHVNLIFSPQPRMDFGIEFLYADREVESGADGDLTRLQFSAKYAY